MVFLASSLGVATRASKLRENIGEQIGKGGSWVGTAGGRPFQPGRHSCPAETFAIF